MESDSSITNKSDDQQQKTLADEKQQLLGQNKVLK